MVINRVTYPTLLSQDTRRNARPGRVGVETERVPRDGGKRDGGETRRARVRQPHRPGAAAAAREAQVEDVHERRQGLVSVVA